MKVLMDTSVLVAAMLPDHTAHAQSVAWLSRAKDGAFEFVASGHSLAEIYSVLTRLPRTPRIAPDEALRLIEDNVVPCATIVTLSDTDYLVLIEELARNGVSGGAVYDGVIAKAAELSDVDYLLTLNTADFQRVWPSGTDRIVSPDAMAPP